MGFATDRHLYRFLDTNGDGTGTKVATGSYSPGTPGIFFIKPPAGQTYRLERMIVSIRDNAGMSGEKYGGLAELANGIIVRAQNDSGTVLDLTDGLPVKANSHWGRLCYDVAINVFSVGDNFVEVRWSFFKSGYELTIGGNENERFEVVCRDDLSGLVDHTFMIQGWRSA
jgi:hypothetical protein